MCLAASQTRRDIADLLAKGKLETAKIRTEVIIADEITIELLELLSVRLESSPAVVYLILI